MRLYNDYGFTANKLPISLSLYYVLCMLYSLHAYFFWHVDQRLFLVAVPLLAVVTYFLNRPYFGKMPISIILYGCVAAVLGTRGNLFGYLSAIVMLAPIFSFVCLRSDYQQYFFHLFKNVFTLIVAISLIGWLINVTIGLPYVPDFYGDQDSDGWYYCQNHFVFIELYESSLMDTMHRFQSIFLEPGYVACLIVMILYIDGMNLKQLGSIILLVALILTYSVAGYILFVMMVLLSAYKKGRHSLLRIIPFAILLGGIYLYGEYYNNGDNEINKRVISRLEYDESRGTVSGYNRTQEAFDSYFDSFVSSPEVFFGNREQYNRLFKDDINVGWKYYIANYGIVALLLYLLFLYSPITQGRKQYECFCLFILMSVIFARGNYAMWMSGLLITYMSGMNCLMNKNIH